MSQTHFWLVRDWPQKAQRAQNGMVNGRERGVSDAQYRASVVIGECEIGLLCRASRKSSADSVADLS